MTTTNEVANKQEAEKKLLAACMMECNKLLATMRTQKPAEAERSKAKLDEIVKRTPKLPLDFKKKLLTDARSFECIANTRATDTALQLALERARKDDLTERNRLVGEARNFCTKAISLGAASSFKATANRKIEIIMMTGGVENKGPTIAKPADTAPKPTSAKA
jgi:hypothetical protein